MSAAPMPMFLVSAEWLDEYELHRPSCEDDDQCTCQPDDAVLEDGLVEKRLY